MFHNISEWTRVFEEAGAYWLHDENPRRPHARLTRGAHSGGFVNAGRIVADHDLLVKAAVDLAEKIMQKIDFYNCIQCVVGPATGATKLAEYLAWALSFRLGRKVSFASPQKVDTETGRTMVFTQADAKLVSRRSCFVCDDVFTTGGSADMTAKAIILCGGTVSSGLASLVNRSMCSAVAGEHLHGPVLSLVHQPMPLFDKEEDCPYCKMGSVAVFPKQSENWKALTRVY